MEIDMTERIKKAAASRQPERRADLREIRAGQARHGAAAARRACRRSGSGAGRGLRARRRRRLPGSQRDRSDSPLHAAFHLELRHRPGHVSAGLLHHEVQPARQRIRRAARRHRHRTSLPAARTFAGLPEDPRDSAKMPARNHRHGRRYAATGRRRARRTHRPAADSRLSRKPRAIRARKC